MRDHSEALLDEEKHLPVPCVGIQRPPMGEGDGRASAPVFVVDRRSVFAGNGVHSVGSSLLDRGSSGHALSSLSGMTSMPNRALPLTFSGVSGRSPSDTQQTTACFRYQT